MSNSTKVSLPDEAYEWLRERYPAAMSDAERIRQAVNDARNAERERLEALQQMEVSESDDSDDPEADNALDNTTDANGRVE